MIWQVYSPAWDLSTLKSSRVTRFSFREKSQPRPASISLVPLNHLSFRGLLPFTMAENVTLEPGMASTGWGGTTKDGGSVGAKTAVRRFKHLYKDPFGFKYLHVDPEGHGRQAGDYLIFLFMSLNACKKTQMRRKRQNPGGLTPDL